MANDSEQSHAVPAQPDVAAPPATGGAYDDIELVAPAVSWSHDEAGYPPEADLDDPDPDSLPESEGMAEDGVEPQDHADPAPAAAAPTPPKRKSALPAWEEMGSHLDELRKRLVIGMSIFIPLFGIGLWLYSDLWLIIIRPLNRAAPHLLRFQALNPSDGLIMAMRIAFAFAFFLSLPVWLSQIWSFIAPGLTARERRYIHLSIGSGGILFCIGAAVAYFVGVPYALAYLLPFNQTLSGWENAFTGPGYVDFVITCCGGFGLAFELPLVMMALAWAGIITPELLREWWRVAVLVIFIIAAVITPPDPFTQLLLAIPMLVLFGLGYWLVKWVHPKK